MPCSTWSRARRNDGKGPGPLRSDTWLYGFPDLSPANASKVQEANNALKHIRRITALCMRRRVPFVIENPLTSRLWLTREIGAMRKEGCVDCDLDFCQFGTPWRKRTRLISSCSALSSLSNTCQLKSGRRCKSGKRHIQLVGRDSNHVFWTARAQAYPKSFCKKAAEIISSVVQTPSSSPPPPDPSYGSGG